MAIDITYAPATNRITVTGGTEGSPADFDDIVAFDRAGTLKLLDGTIDADPDTFSLDRQVRPVELRALQLEISCTARGGATCDIAGKDAWGNAITENGIDISSGSATTTKRFSEVDSSGVTVNGLQNGDDFDIDQGQWGIIWDYSGENTYILDAYIYLGDGTISTYFKDVNKTIIISDRTRQYASGTYMFYAYNNAHIQLGELLDEANKATYHGCIIHNMRQTYTHLFSYSSSAKRYLYGCTFSTLNSWGSRNALWVYDNSRYWNCNLINYGDFYIVGDGDIYNITIMGGTDVIKDDPLLVYSGSPTINDVKATNGRYVIRWYPSYDIEIRKMIATADYAVGIWYSSFSKTMKLIDCSFSNWIMWKVAGTGEILRQYACNIHVADRDGTDLESVNITCKDKYGNTVFSVNTDVNGNITEQEITYQRWHDLGTGYYGEGDAEQFSPHKFIISKSGYETIELDEITVDEPIKWHLELQDPIPVCDYPVEGDVEKDVVYDSGAKTGNFEAPLEEDVEKGVGYGSQGTEFLGTLEAGLVLAGQNLEGQLEPKINLTGNLQENANMVGVLGKADIMIGVLQEKTVMVGKLRKTGLVGEMK